MKYWMFNTRGMVVETMKGTKRFAARKAFGIIFSSKKKATLARDRVKRLFQRI